MIVLPAIDILDGQAVRLYQGDYHKKECVGKNIMDIATSFEKDGAHYIHMVDLNGAKQGKRVNYEVIKEVVKTVHVPVEVGGGIRCMADVEAYLEQGVARVILGTSAIEDASFLQAAIQKYGKRIVVGMDCRNGLAYGEGWLKQSHEDYLSFAKKLEAMGVSTIVFTDIAKDGTMSGPNIPMLQKLLQHVSMNVIASGGICDITHVQLLHELGVYGAITGKALYAQTLSLREAILACQEV